jgi:hypothetical protein
MGGAGEPGIAQIVGVDATGGQKLGVFDAQDSSAENAHDSPALRIADPDLTGARQWHRVSLRGDIGPDGRTPMNR